MCTHSAKSWENVDEDEPNGSTYTPPAKQMFQNIEHIVLNNWYYQNDWNEPR